MTRYSKSALLLGAALAVLSACSGTKGPGDIGSKEDIVVRNNGLPGAAKAPPPNADFSSTVEQGDAVPAPSVESAQPLPDTSPAVEAAEQQNTAENAPLPSTTATPMNEDTTANPAPTAETNALDQIAPQVPVEQTNVSPAQAPAEAAYPVQEPAPVVVDQSQLAPPPVAPVASEQVAAPVETPAYAPAPAPEPVQAYVPSPAPSTSVYPAEDYTAAGMRAPGSVSTPPPATMPVAVPSAPVAAAPASESLSPNAYVPVPAGTEYPLDPNAPYSPKAMAAQTGADVAAPVMSASRFNLSDPAIIRSAQNALKTKGGYAGEPTGTLDAAFLNALVIYQGANKLPQTGLNEETLRHLGVIE